MQPPEQPADLLEDTALPVSGVMVSGYSDCSVMCRVTTPSLLMGFDTNELTAHNHARPNASVSWSIRPTAAMLVAMSRKLFKRRLIGSSSRSSSRKMSSSRKRSRLLQRQVRSSRPSSPAIRSPQWLFSQQPRQCLKLPATTVLLKSEEAA